MRANLFRPIAGTPTVSPARAYRTPCRPSRARPAPRPVRRRRSKAWSCAYRLRAGRDRKPWSLLPEVQQPAGDDVALHLGGAAVDAGRPRVQVLGAPGGLVEFDCAGQQVADGVIELLL